MKPTIIMTFQYITIILLCLFMLFDQCARKPCPEPQTVTNTITIPGDPYPVRYDSIIYRDTTIYKRDSTAFKPVPEGIDSAKIARLYYAENYSNRVLTDDTSLYYAVEFMTTQNRVQWFIPTYQNKRETAIINQINNIYPDKTEAFGLKAGFGGYVSPQASDVYPSLMLRYKTFYFSYGYGFKGSHVFGVYFTIF